MKKLIAGPNVYICDECIQLCNDIIAEEVENEELLEPTGKVLLLVTSKKFLMITLSVKIEQRER